MCDISISKRPSFSRIVNSRSTNRQQSQRRSANGRVKGRTAKPKPKPLCLEEINAARRNANVQQLKFNSRMTDGAKYSVNWIVRWDCRHEGFMPMPVPLKRVGTITRWTFKDIGETKFAREDKNRMTSNIIVSEWLNTPDQKVTLLSAGYTEVGCFSGRCSNLIQNFYTYCFFGKKK